MREAKIKSLKIKLVHKNLCLSPIQLCQGSMMTSVTRNYFSEVGHIF